MPPPPRLLVDGAAPAEEKVQAIYNTARLTNATPREPTQILGEPELNSNPVFMIKVMLLAVQNKNKQIMQPLEQQATMVTKAVDVLTADNCKQSCQPEACSKMPSPPKPTVEEAKAVEEMVPADYDTMSLANTKSQDSKRQKFDEHHFKKVRELDSKLEQVSWTNAMLGPNRNLSAQIMQLHEDQGALLTKVKKVVGEIKANCNLQSCLLEAHNGKFPPHLAQPAVHGAAASEEKRIPPVRGDDKTRLSMATPEEQKQIRGEGLFSKIRELMHETLEAGKITNLLLSSDNEHNILHVLKYQVGLVAKVEEAVEVIEATRRS